MKHLQARRYSVILERMVHQREAKDAEKTIFIIETPSTVISSWFSHDSTSLKRPVRFTVFDGGKYKEEGQNCTWKGIRFLCYFLYFILGHWKKNHASICRTCQIKHLRAKFIRFKWPFFFPMGSLYCRNCGGYTKHEHWMRYFQN